MSAERVEAALDAIGRQDAALGEWALVAADGLTAGEGTDVLSQAAVQAFLWYRLPTRYPSETWVSIARATVALMGALGRQRYASIAGSPATTAILEAWADDARRGFSAYRAAVASSGVKPPDTDLLHWGAVMGLEEATAHANLERLLEGAIVAGDFKPGAAGWKASAASLCERALREPAPHASPESWLSVVIRERVDTWIKLGHPERLRAWRARVADRLLAPPEPPEEPDAVIEPMHWLLTTCRSGVTLTASGYLPPRLVHEATERFGWWDWPGRARSESDVHQLGVLRESTSRLKLITKQGRRLATSRRGRGLLGDPVALWRAIAATIGAVDDFSSMLSELVAHRLLAGPAVGDELAQAIAPIVMAQGWASGGVPLDEQQAGWAIHRPLYHWRLFGLLEEVRPRWEYNRPTGPEVTSLNAAGRATALAYLHTLATGPRVDLRA